MKFCGEIQYDNEKGGVHSDICFSCYGDKGNTPDAEYRKFLHDVLDEWLDKANGTGIFWVGSNEYWEAVGEDYKELAKYELIEQIKEMMK